MLVFALANKKAPASLWSEFFPRTKMVWDWNDDGDTKVADLWHLREELSRSGKVVYAKWYQGRATFFSREVFVALLAELRRTPAFTKGLKEEAVRLHRILEETSPLSTKELKSAAELQGKFFESTYTSSLKQLWDRLLIVGCGEKDDGAFPSLQMGATSLIFEDLWKASLKTSPEAAAKILRHLRSEDSLFIKYFERVSHLLVPKGAGAAQALIGTRR